MGAKTGIAWQRIAGYEEVMETSGALSIYEASKRALAEARNTVEVLDIKDKAETMRLFAIQTHNNELLAWAIEIKTRAKIRLGELLIESGRNGTRRKSGGDYTS
jgi:hypothetical protein